MAVELNKNGLKKGTKLSGYEIIRELGSGSFGITYLSRDLNLNVNVVIKEFLPSDIAMRNNDDSTVQPRGKEDQEFFNYGLSRFLRRAYYFPSAIESAV